MPLPWPLVRVPNITMASLTYGTLRRHTY
ncbi:hypothetical protein JMJ77_0015425, partial [Colletotrichum scovillei]